MNGIRRQERSFYGRVRLDQLVRSTKGDKMAINRHLLTNLLLYALVGSAILEVISLFAFHNVTIGVILFIYILLFGGLGTLNVETTKEDNVAIKDLINKHKIVSAYVGLVILGSLYLFFGPMIHNSYISSIFLILALLLIFFIIYVLSREVKEEDQHADSHRR